MPAAKASEVAELIHTFWRNYQPSSLSSSTVHNLNNVNELLLIIHGPVDFVVVSSAQINHDVLVAEEKHDSAWVIQLVHGVEIRNF